MSDAPRIDEPKKVGGKPTRSWSVRHLRVDLIYRMKLLAAARSRTVEMTANDIFEAGLLVLEKLHEQEKKREDW